MQGTRLGPYEILDRLGEGGMGEVWLAEDGRLGRKVAIKVLPTRFVAAPDRLARFEQEARAAAALNHPHIAVVHDVGVEGEGNARVHFMVQEYLRGEPLRAHLASGPLGLPRALELATEIAEALGAAHAAGIVHRDLKPDNVFVTEDGHAKVLDFGLAKLTERTGGFEGSESMSPTMVGTQAGEIMGTAGYMAPEQVAGEPVDHRADLFAFGCVLYEMTTGSRPFAGESVYDTLHRIGHAEPPALERVDPELPAKLQWILDKCLMKEPARRYQGAGDLAVDLRRLGLEVEKQETVSLGAVRAAVDGGAAGGVAGGDPATTGAAGRGISRSVALVGALAAAAIGVLATGWLLAPSPSEPMALSIPLGTELAAFQPLVISPDGRKLAYLPASQESPIRLRDLGAFDTRELPGTERARTPFFSPDGDELGFFRGSSLLVATLDTGTVRTLCSECIDAAGAAWSPDGETILVSDRGLVRVGARDGQIERVLSPDSLPEGRLALILPHFLPDGEHALAMLVGDRIMLDHELVVVDLSDGSMRLLEISGQLPAYVSSGHLVYSRSGALMVAPFDVERAELTGPAEVLLPEVATDQIGIAQAVVSRTGRLVYQPGRSAGASYGLTWVPLDGMGEPEVLAVPEGDDEWAMPRLSPDGRRIAVVRVGEVSEVFTYEIAQSSLQPVASGGAHHPLWSPDGRWLYFARQGDEGNDIYRRRVNTSLPAELVLGGEGHQWPTDFDATGTRLLYQSGVTDFDVRVAEIDPDSGVVADTREVVSSPDPEVHGVFSPDGRWLAYMLVGGGSSEIWVQEYPGPGQRWKVSVDTGATFPVWNGSGLYYDVSGTMRRVNYVAGDDGFEPGAVETVIEGPILMYTSLGTNYDVSPDGTRVLIPRGPAIAGDAAPYLNVVPDIRAQLAASRPR